MKENEIRKIFAKNLRYYMNKEDLTNIEVSRILGVSESAVGKWLLEKATPRMGAVEKLAQYFGVLKSDLLEDKKNFDESVQSYRLQVLDDIAGGVPLEANTDVYPDEWEEIPLNWLVGDNEYIALKVSGDSMAPRICDGDIAIIQLTQDYQHGDICAVYVNGLNATLKKILKKRDGTIILQPLNPVYVPEIYTPEDQQREPVVVLGRMVELRAKF